MNLKKNTLKYGVHLREELLKLCLLFLGGSQKTHLNIHFQSPYIELDGKTLCKKQKQKLFIYRDITFCFYNFNFKVYSLKDKKKLCKIKKKL